MTHRDKSERDRRDNTQPNFLKSRFRTRTFTADLKVVLSSSHENLSGQLKIERFRRLPTRVLAYVTAIWITAHQAQPAWSAAGSFTIVLLNSRRIAMQIARGHEKINAKRPNRGAKGSVGSPVGDSSNSVASTAAACRMHQEGEGGRVVQRV